MGEDRLDVYRLYSRSRDFYPPETDRVLTPVKVRTPEYSDSFENRVEIKLEKSDRKRLQQEIIADNTKIGAQIGFVSGCASSIVGIPLVTILLGKSSSKAGVIAAGVLASVGWVTGAVGAGIGAGIGQVAGRIKAAGV